jgi:uncharacterized protein
MHLDVIFWIFGAAAFLVGLSKGGLPAIGMLAVPLSSLVMSPVQAAALLLPIYVLSDVVAVWLYRRDFSAPNLRVLLPAGVLGVLLGWALVAVVSERAVTLLIGSIGIAFCLNVWLRKGQQAPARTPSRGLGWFWGTLAGFTSFVSHAGAPPFQMYVLPQKLPKAVFAGTATIVFAVINAAKIVPYQMLRPYSPAMMKEALVLVPFALAGTVVGAYLTRRLPERWFFLFVQLSLFAVSVKLVADALR